MSLHVAVAVGVRIEDDSLEEAGPLLRVTGAFKVGGPPVRVVVGGVRLVAFLMLYSREGGEGDGGGAREGGLVVDAGFVEGQRLPVPGGMDDAGRQPEVDALGCANGAGEVGGIAW